MKTLPFLLLGAFLISTAHAAPIKPSLRHDAASNKLGKYATEGFFAGGDKAVTSAKLKDIRRANSNEGYERIVLDLQSLAGTSGEVPYFQVQSAPQEGRLILSIWAEVAYDFDSAQVHRSFQKSSHVKRLNVLPRVEDGLTVMEFQLNPAYTKKNVKFEAFRLAKPARIIIDLI